MEKKYNIRDNSNISNNTYKENTNENNNILEYIQYSTDLEREMRNISEKFNLKTVSLKHYYGIY